LPHQVDPLRLHSKARAHYGQVAFDLPTGLPSQPVLEAACRRGLRCRCSSHHDLAVDKSDSIPACPRLGRLDADSRRLPSKQDLSGRAQRGAAHASKPGHTLKLTEYPRLVSIQERRHVFTVAIRRLHDLYPIRADTKPQLSCGS
jgi:hypothetical protein